MLFYSDYDGFLPFYSPVLFHSSISKDLFFLHFFPQIIHRLFLKHRKQAIFPICGKQFRFPQFSVNYSLKPLIYKDFLPVNNLWINFFNVLLSSFYFPAASSLSDSVHLPLSVLSFWLFHVKHPSQNEKSGSENCGFAIWGPSFVS